MEKQSTINVMIDHESDQLFKIHFFEPFFMNYIAEFQPKFIQNMDDSTYAKYIVTQSQLALDEFCSQIRAGESTENAIVAAKRVLLLDFAQE